MGEYVHHKHRDERKGNVHPLSSFFNPHRCILEIGDDLHRLSSGEDWKGQEKGD